MDLHPNAVLPSIDDQLCNLIDNSAIVQTKEATKHVLAVAYGGGHIAMMLPVIRALRARHPGIRIQLLALTTAQRPALEAGEHPLGYADLWRLLSSAERTQALDLGRELRGGNTHPDIPEAETLAYLGINALDMHQRLGAARARLLLAEHGRQAFYPIGFFRRVMNDLQPDLVITTNSPRSEQAALDAADEAGVPTLAMLDLFGLGSSPKPALDLAPSREVASGSNITATSTGDAFAMRTRRPRRVCVLAEAVRENLVAAGWPRESIAVTGNPAFDALFAPAMQQAATSLRMQLGWTNKKVVLLAAQPEPRSHPASRWPAGDALPLAMEAQLRQWVGTRPDAALLVRHHPNHWHRFPRLADSAQVHFSVPSEEPAESVILAADTVVVQNSTVGLQAAIVGIPVLAMQCSPGSLSTFSYADLGIAAGVRDVTDLPSAIDMVLDHRPPATGWARKSNAADAVAQEVSMLLVTQGTKAIDQPARHSKA